MTDLWGFRIVIVNAGSAHAHRYQLVTKQPSARPCSNLKLPAPDGGLSPILREISMKAQGEGHH